MNILLPPNALDATGRYEIYIYLQLIAVFTLLLLLIGRELTISMGMPYSNWRRIALIGIAPLFIAFLLILLWQITL